jgi:DNA-binding NarL/FixJ family response regulator
MNVTGQPYKVLLVDEQSIVRLGLRNLLEARDGIGVCAEVSNGTEAPDHIKKTKPNLVLLDLTMPEMNGLDTARAIRDVAPQTEILILSMHSSEEIAREAKRRGARWYILKSDAISELLTAVDRVRIGEQYFTNRLASTMAKSFADMNPEKSEEPLQSGSGLTSREVEVVQLLTRGRSSKEVSAVMRVSKRTMGSHRDHIMHKMHFRSVSELVRFAIRNNLVES